MYKSKADLTEHEGYIGYHICPIDNSISVGKTGKVRSTQTGELLSIYPSGDYLAVTSPKTSKSTYVHRLMAETYLKSPSKNIAKPIVNHKDGDKKNNAYMNLEWCTYGDNIVHAFETGLRTDNVQIESKDLRTGEVSKFISIQECGRYFNRNGEAVHRYIHGSREWPFMVYFTLRRVGEPWSNLTEEDIGKAPPGTARLIIADPTRGNGDRYIFPSGAACARHFGICGSEVTRHLKSGKEFVSIGYKLFYVDAYGRLDEGLVNIREISSKPKPPTRRPKSVEVINLETEEVKVYSSIKEFAEVIGSTKAAVARSVWKNKGRWRNYSIRYL